MLLPPPPTRKKTISLDMNDRQLNEINITDGIVNC